MFGNVESKLKKLAKVICVCGIVLSLFILCICSVLDSVNGFFIGILCGLVLFASALIAAWFIYAFAELLEETKKINSTLQEISGTCKADFLKLFSKMPKEQ